jgi:hypothetical protein
MVRYTFKEILTIKAADKADPQKIGEALAALAGKAGELTPKAVVESARNPRSIFHRHFEWDNLIAAEAYRLDQARTLIRSVRVEEPDAEDGYAMAFVSISDKGGTSYRTLGAIKGDASLQAKVLEQAGRDLQAWQNRYRALEDVCAVVRQAQALVERKRTKKPAAHTESHAQA